MRPYSLQFEPIRDNNFTFIFVNRKKTKTLSTNFEVHNNHGDEPLLSTKIKDLRHFMLR